MLSTHTTLRQAVKLKDFLREMNIPLHVRDSIPVVELRGPPATPSGAEDRGKEGGTVRDDNAGEPPQSYCLVPAIAAVYPGAVGAGFYSQAPDAEETAGGEAPAIDENNEASFLLRAVGVGQAVAGVAPPTPDVTSGKQQQNLIVGILLHIVACT